MNGMAGQMGSMQNGGATGSSYNGMAGGGGPGGAGMIQNPLNNSVFAP